MAPSSERAPCPSWCSWLPARLPARRALVTDLLRLHRQIPTVSQQRRFHLSELSQLRDRCHPRISWPVLFLKSYGLVARHYPNLRRTLIQWPWPHLYEHPTSVATVAVTREFHGEPWLLFAPINQPETRSLNWLQQELDRYKHEPVEKRFKTQIKLAHYPKLVRSVFWWLRMNASPRKRIKRLGTFGLTTVAGQGATILDPKAPVTSLLTYGPLDETGHCAVVVAYDHRVMDGQEVAEILQRLELTLQTDVADELRALSAKPLPTPNPLAAA